MNAQTRTFTVTGMACEHCVASVREEVGALPGVASVEVDLASGATRRDGHEPRRRGGARRGRRGRVRGRPMRVAAFRMGAQVRTVGFTIEVMP
jgi:copper chaperone